jgi:D-inositol-3-phosphate glycosyltransferase
MRVPRPVRRIATISVHTSPLDQPGTGDAGGMNVYIVEAARRLAERGIEVDIFTRATCRALPPVVEAAPGVYVRHVVAGPFEELPKEALLAWLCDFTSGVLRTEAAHDAGHYDLLHTHYWLSGRAGSPIRRRLGVPLVHSMHTLAKVKNASLADGDAAEPSIRILGEEEVVASADRLVANTAEEAAQLVQLYGADPERVDIVTPGVDLSVFRPDRPQDMPHRPEDLRHRPEDLRARSEDLRALSPGPLGPDGTGRSGLPGGGRPAARRRLGLPDGALVLLFVGRVQPLKAPHVLLRAAAEMIEEDPALRARLVVAVVGGPSGSALARPEELQNLARHLGIADIVRFEPPCPQHELADWYRAATATVIPSYNESFGLVAVESQACGTPVVAAAVGGLNTAVRDGETGVLVAGHDPRDYAAVLRRLAGDPSLRARLARAAVEHARGFGWAATVDRLLEVYTGAVTEPTTVIA